MHQEIAIVRQHRDVDPFEREVEGLIEICQYLSTASPEEKAAVKFLNRMNLSLLLLLVLLSSLLLLLLLG